MDEIIKERYNSEQWNVYAAQASDGDNWADDTPQCGQILRNKLLNAVRYFAYYRNNHTGASKFMARVSRHNPKPC